MPSSPTYEANWSGYRSRPSEARRLLESARCRRGSDGVHVCEGRRLSLAVATTSGAERRQLILEVLQQQLGRLGVEVRPQFFAGLSPIRQALREGTADVALFSWEHDVNELRARFGCGGSDNYTGHCSRLATRELGNAERVLDDSSQARALNRADRLLARDVPVLPLFQIPNLVALRAGIRNFDPETLLRTAENWWLDR